MNILLCTACALGQTGFAVMLTDALHRAGIAAQVRPAGCMSRCARPSTIAFREAGKTAYLFGDLTTADLPDLLVFARMYAASPDGGFADARPLGGLRTKALARIPG